MKCINKKNICLLLLLCTLIFSGCGKTVESVTFSNAYDIYETSKKYHLNQHCSGLISHNQLPIMTAIQNGYTPCHKCCAKLLKDFPLLGMNILIKEDSQISSFELPQIE